MYCCKLTGNRRSVSFHEGWHWKCGSTLLTLVTLPQGCKGRSLLWQLPCMNSALPWLPTSALVPLRHPWSTEFSESHETQDNCSRRRRVRVKPCYGLLGHGQWLYLGIQRWWRFQWWSPKNVRVSAQNTAFVDIWWSCPRSVISLQ